MGLRQDKQRAQRRLIIENTLALIRESGLERTRVGDIAARSDISDATFFNYFASKDTVLREWADEIVDGIFVDAAARHAQGTGLRRAVRGLADDLAARVRAADELADCLAKTRIVPESAGREWARGRVARPSGALLLIEAAQTRDEIRADVPALQLAEMLRSVVLAAAAYALAPGPSIPDDLAERVRNAADVLLDGMRRRNERVRIRPPGGDRPGPSVEEPAAVV